MSYKGRTASSSIVPDTYHAEISAPPDIRDIWAFDSSVSVNTVRQWSQYAQ